MLEAEVGVTIIHAYILGEIRAVKDYNYIYLIASTAKYKCVF